MLWAIHSRLDALEPTMNPMSLMTLPAGMLRQPRHEHAPHGERAERAYALMGAVAVMLVAAIAAFA